MKQGYKRCRCRVTSPVFEPVAISTFSTVNIIPQLCGWRSNQWTPPNILKICCLPALNCEYGSLEGMCYCWPIIPSPFAVSIAAGLTCSCLSCVSQHAPFTRHLTQGIVRKKVWWKVRVQIESLTKGLEHRVLNLLSLWLFISFSLGVNVKIPAFNCLSRLSWMALIQPRPTFFHPHNKPPSPILTLPTHIVYTPPAIAYSLHVTWKETLNLIVRSCKRSKHLNVSS